LNNFNNFDYNFNNNGADGGNIDTNGITMNDNGSFNSNTYNDNTTIGLDLFLQYHNIYIYYSLSLILI
jgi:hypothetical protein